MELEIRGQPGNAKQTFRFRNPALTPERLSEVKALAERLLRQAEERAPGLVASPGAPPPSTQLALLALVELAADYLASRDRVAAYQTELREALRSESH